MKVTDRFSWDKEPYAPAREPAKAVVGAMQDAARWLDTVQEWVLMDAGMPHTARVVHDMAHTFPAKFDKFIDMLHEQHLKGEYPSTAELTEPIESVDKAFELVIAALDNVKTALTEFHSVTDNDDIRPMALYAENALQENSADYTKILFMWKMWDENGNKTSYDNWVKDFGKE